MNQCIVEIIFQQYIDMTILILIYNTYRYYVDVTCKVSEFAQFRPIYPDTQIHVCCSSLDVLFSCLVV